MDELSKLVSALVQLLLISNSSLKAFFILLLLLGLGIHQKILCVLSKNSVNYQSLG